MKLNIAQFDFFAKCQGNSMIKQLSFEQMVLKLVNNNTQNEQISKNQKKNLDLYVAYIYMNRNMNHSPIFKT